MNKKRLLEGEWSEILEEKLNDSIVKELFNFLKQEREAGKEIYPKQDHLFKALNSTPISEVKIVILGQDPYHGEGQAHGLSFSVEQGVKVPPSLRNIYKELEDDIDFKIPNHGDLSEWSNRGVLLLNSVLTVEQGLPASHKNKGWEWFTDQIINEINSRCEGVVFLLWGAYAQKKGKSIDLEKHLVLSAVHPSPLSAHRGFFGCKHFSKANNYLSNKGRKKVDWQIT